MPEDPAAPLRAAVVQDATTREVLMVGWMDDEAERATLATGDVHFHSRSRGELWRKGATSGNVLRLERIERDCDGDALLVLVRPDGPTCHGGTRSCFAPWLWRRVVERSGGDPATSYVARQLAAGTAAVARKVAEEATELVVAALIEPDDRVVSEAADLWFHVLLVLRARGLDPGDVEGELRRRADAADALGSPAGEHR